MSQNRYSSTQAYRPLRKPQTVEDQDACALYAAVRKDGKQTHDVIEKGFVALAKMLHRAGNVDGEGDGCGVMVDIPRAIWQEEIRDGGHAPSLALDPVFAVAHIFVSRKRDFAESSRRPTRSSTAAACGCSASAPTRSTARRSGRPRARRSRTSGRSA